MVISYGYIRTLVPLSLLRGWLRGLVMLVPVVTIAVHHRVAGGVGRGAVPVARAHLGEREQGVGEVWRRCRRVARCHDLNIKEGNMKL